MLKGFKYRLDLNNMQKEYFNKTFGCCRLVYNLALATKRQAYESTKTCSFCGEVNKELELKDREWTCDICGTNHDRDLNAAQNILKEGLRILNKASSVGAKEDAELSTVVGAKKRQLNLI